MFQTIPKLRGVVQRRDRSVRILASTAAARAKWLGDFSLPESLPGPLRTAKSIFEAWIDLLVLPDRKGDSYYGNLIKMSSSTVKHLVSAECESPKASL